MSEPQTEPLDLGAYLRRVGLRSPPPATLDGLKALHRAQVQTIPFENFDILLRRGIDPSRPAIFAKTLQKRRGGYCFELNELAFAALEALGFAARRCLARVHVSGRPSPHTHQFSLATIDGQDYVVDAGFGGQSPRGPIPLLLDVTTQIGFKRYRLVAAPPFGTKLQDWWLNAWRDLYSFDLRPVLEPDRIMGNHMTSTHPSSFFTWTKTASIQTSEARFSLFDGLLTHETAQGVAETPIPNGEAYLEVLETVFGLELDARYEDLAPLNPPPPRPNGK